VVVVGAGTVRLDDPQLTVRRCAGPNPVRAVVDSGRRLGSSHRLFTDRAARTLLLCTQELAQAGERPGEAELVGVPGDGNGLYPHAILDVLAARGLDLVFVEGGGVTVSRFLEAGALDRLQVTVAPLILGSGRPSITLSEVDSLAGALRPRTRRFLLGEDVLFDCVLRP
jgi:riboflavin-specific deaminase-like protein